MAAKKMPPKKQIPAKKSMPAKKAATPGKSKNNGLVSDKEATEILKRAFLGTAKSMGASDIRKYGGNVAPKRQGSAKQWAQNVDNAMGDTWFEGSEVAKVGYERANAILRANREKWISPMYNKTIGVRATNINKANKSLPKKKK